MNDYATANVDKYFLLLLGISLLGVILNLLPPIRAFVEDIEERAADMVRTPKTPMRPPRRERELEAAENSSDEESALLKAQRHQAYLKYGSGPALYKSGSMRAGPNLSQRKLKDRHIKKNAIRKLYKGETGIPRGTRSRKGVGGAGVAMPGGAALIPPREGGAGGGNGIPRVHSTGDAPKLARSSTG